MKQGFKYGCAQNIITAMYSDAFLADTRIDADAVNTVTIKVKV